MREAVNPRVGPPLIVGEVLWDRLPQQAVLGGAALNVAWNLKGLGGEPILISRLGQDPAGEQLLAAIQQQGLNSSALQWDPIHPTGAVEVEVDEQGIPSYRILPDQAYDYIELDGEALRALQPSVLYRGSLAARTAAAHHRFQTLISTLDCPVLLDLNLRDPWWTPTGVREMLRSCHWLKLNQEELAQVAALEGIPDPTPLAQAQKLFRILQLDKLFLTLGPAGAVLISRSRIHHAEPVAVPPLVDTVGAGDGFCAVVILGWLQGWPEVTLLNRAVQFATALCGVAGGTPRDPEFYRPFRQAWGLEMPDSPS